MSLAAAHSGAYKPTKPLATTSARFLGSSRTLLHSSSKNRTTSGTLDSPGLSPLEYYFAKIETFESRRVSTEYSWLSNSHQWR